MNIDIERLKTDPDYWDEVGAPVDATHYGPEDVDWVEGWYKATSPVIVFMRFGGSKYTSSVDRPVRELIPRPTKKQWDGPQDGLPPVGYTQNDCSLAHLDESDKFTVVAHFHDHAIVAFGPGPLGKTVMATAAKQSESERIKSPRKRAIEHAARTLGELCPLPEVLNALADHDLLKLPEDSQ